MRAARTGSQLVEQLDAELAWRIYEIAALREAIHRASEGAQAAIIRSAVALLYAHWEGFIKAAAVQYGAFLSRQSLTFGQARLSFSGLKALGHVKQLHAINKKVFVASELLTLLFAIENEKVALPLQSHLSEIGNLTYEVFEQIAQFLSLDCSNYVAKKNLIDEALVKSRNHIAHGEYLEISSERFEELSTEILELVRQFKTDIQNAVVLKTYLRTASVPISSA